MKLKTPSAPQSEMHHKVTRPVVWTSLITAGFTAAAASVIAFNASKVHIKKPYFIKVQNNDSEYSLNIDKIKWITKSDDCYLICAKDDGCFLDKNIHHDKWQVCKGSQSYDKVAQLYLE